MPSAGPEEVNLPVVRGTLRGPRSKELKKPLNAESDPQHNKKVNSTNNHEFLEKNPNPRRDHSLADT